MPINEEELREYREKLLEMRNALKGSVDELARDAAKSTEAVETSRGAEDHADNAADTYAQDFAFMGMESEGKLLHAVEGALVRMREGVYGVCVDCKEEIARERLKALPFAERCVSCQAAGESDDTRMRAEEFALPDDTDDILSSDD